MTSILKSLQINSKQQARAKIIRRQADAARDSRKYSEAAVLYKEYLDVNPADAPIHIQCAHMNKEIGQLDIAGKHYELALELTPTDVDLHVQLGHFHKVSGNVSAALAAYKRALELDPTNTAALKEIGGTTELLHAPKQQKLQMKFAVEARAKLLRNASEYLRNVPADRFDAAIDAVYESKSFYLIEGVDQRFPDESLSDASIEKCLRICVDAEDYWTLNNILKSISKYRTNIKVGLDILLKVSQEFEKKSSVALPVHQLPFDAQVAMFSVATNIIMRQRDIINDLMGN